LSTEELWFLVLCGLFTYSYSGGGEWWRGGRKIEMGREGGKGKMEMVVGGEKWREGG
jgi:hypothetical protein